MNIPPEAQQDAALIAAGEYAIPMKYKPHRVLDIGANVGLFSDWALRQWPECEVVAFEPHPDNVARFRDNVRSSRVQFYAMAVSDRGGRARLRIGRNAMCHRLDGDGELEVDTMKASFLPRAEFVKIDVEGHELPILRDLDLSETEALAVEYHSDDDAAEIRALLFGLGFVMHEHKRYRKGLGIYKFTRWIQDTKIFIANCVDNGADHDWYHCMDALAEQQPCEMVAQEIVGDSLVCRARNVLSGAFMKSDCSHLLFIDSDILFQPRDVARLFSRKVPLVAGFYPKKQPNLEWVCNAHPIGQEAPQSDGLQRMRYMGTGFMLIAREVFDRMRTALDIAYHPDMLPKEWEWDFWKVGLYDFADGSRRYLSEDWYFCQRAHDLGFDVWADTSVAVQHVGRIAYPLPSERSKYVVKIDADAQGECPTSATHSPQASPTPSPPSAEAS